MKNQLIITFICLTAGCATEKKDKTEQKQDPATQAAYRVERQYSFADLENLDSAERRIKRNEIFAQYGYRFRSPELKEYFLDQEWYEPRYDNVDSFLTELDQANIQVFTVFERGRKEAENFSCDHFYSQLTSFAFEASIKKAIDSLGAPGRSFIHEDPTCSIGQLHYWEDHLKNRQIVILGDDYSGVTNYSAESRYYAVQVLNGSPQGSFTFYGVTLGDQEASVRKKLDCLTQENSGFTLKEVTANSIVEIHYIRDQEKQYVIATDSLWIRLIIDNKKRLKAIVFASFDDHLAC